jgi:rhodanese-related sulfurtransferase
VAQTSEVTLPDQLKMTNADVPAGRASGGERGDELRKAGRAIVMSVFFDQVPTIPPSGVEAKVADGWMLLDVRTDDEWSGGRIPGSVHIPMDQLMARLDEVDDQVVCICAVGSRSARVADYLNGQGREAVNLDGGIYAWAAAGLPIET